MELIPGDIESIREANPYISQKAEWKILIPGFPTNGKSPFPNNVRDAYLQRMQNYPNETYNIIVADWDRSSMCSKNTLTEKSQLTFTTVAGQQVAEMLMFLSDKEQLYLEKNVHMIGFSMGAHVGDEAARFVKMQFHKKRIIYRLTALDPVGDMFWYSQAVRNIPHPRPIIERSFVVYQDTYYTSSSQRYGSDKGIGDLEFIVNNAQRQPGCKVANNVKSKIYYFEGKSVNFYN